MLIIDQYSYANGLRSVSPELKALISLGGLMLALISQQSVFHLIILLINSLLICFKAKINVKSYVNLLMIPVIFILLSILSVVINIDTQSLLNPLISGRFFNLYVGITEQSVGQGLLLLTRSVAAISSTYFMILTTPMTDLMKLLKAIHVPTIIIEIMVLTYKFIFVLLDESKKIYEAQYIRNGYKGLKNSYHSIGILVKMILINSLNRYKKMQETLELRQFNGEFYL